MESWSFLTNHARVLLRIAQDPGARLRDIAAAVGITERSAYGIVTDLTVAGFVVKHKDGRRNRYQIQAHLPLPEPASQEPAIGDVLAILIGEEAKQEPAPGPAAPVNTTAAGRPPPGTRGSRNGSRARARIGLPASGNTRPAIRADWTANVEPKRFLTRLDGPTGSR